MRLISVLFLICLSGCNSYQKFYTEGYGVYYKKPEDYHNQPQVRNVAASSHSSVYGDLIEQGYKCLGESSFSSGMNPSQREAINLAKKIGADLVILSKSHQRTVHGSYSYTTPTQSTTYHSGNVNTYGSYGSSTGYYSGSSTTYGSQTTSIPYTINRYNYRASFFVWAEDSENDNSESFDYREIIDDPEFIRKDDESFQKFKRGEISMDKRLEELKELRRVYASSQENQKDNPSSVYLPSSSDSNLEINSEPLPPLYESNFNFKEENKKLFEKYKSGEITRDEYFQEYKLLKTKQPK